MTGDLMRSNSVAEMQATVENYFAELARLPDQTVVTGRDGAEMTMAELFPIMCERFARHRDGAGKLMFVGNGASASIASHMALDFSKNGKVPALAFNDAAALTALSNDEGYDQVFAKQIEYFAAEGDLLVAISSSGNSENIIKAVLAARAKNCDVLTLSGLGAKNQLRQMGDYNMFVPSGEYGFVEVVHGGLIHALLDIFMGWSAQSGLWNKSDVKPLQERGVA
ncbi:MAG: SIS domain-containing protein [Rhodospirillaceae bacterium]|jgi:D-sedoheptulose 7-phosphate isomerase|nr:SIS domain-containing protein [Rhodospirillaceae bacterium]MBT5191381.1 SIS domain-containing protein [Rhodospirillaceae bacterium]MBT5896394.1 SIS domain-containing protein [Rhodospirillaceae bacterium]MBT6426104.1 SIS domain-containing protein [Rhodospirillaceae bacterium]MBT6608450.1 SIS domain-containing protein [Rhodospirillaceae bacterium]